MSIDPKTITVFLDVSPSGRNRAAHAAALAQRSGAHLVGVHVVFAGVTLHPSMSYARGHKAIDQVITHERQLDAAAEATAALMGGNFRSLCARLNIPGEFRPIDRGKTAEEAILNSLHSDLVVVGHPEPDGLRDDILPEKILLASGAPILIVPSGWKSESISRKILVGWNASREARRAVADAPPFLVAAQSVMLSAAGAIDDGAVEARTGTALAHDRQGS